MTPPEWLARATEAVAEAGTEEGVVQALFTWAERLTGLPYWCITGNREEGPGTSCSPALRALLGDPATCLAWPPGDPLPEPAVPLWLGTEALEASPPGWPFRPRNVVVVRLPGGTGGDLLLGATSEGPRVPPPLDHFQLLGNLVRITALALKRRSASTHLQVSLRQAERLAEATRLMGAAPSLETLFQVLSNEARALVPLRHWWYNRFDPGTRQSQTVFWTPELDRFLLRETIQAPDPVDGQPFMEQLHYEHTPVFIPDCAAHPYFTSERLARFPHRSVVGIPLVYEGQVGGVLMGGSFHDEPHFTLDEVRPQALLSLCQSAALAINGLEAKTALTDSEARFRDLFECAPDPILLMDHRRIVDANAAALRLYGRTRGELLGQDFSALAPGEQAPDAPSGAWAQAHLDAAGTGQPQRFEWVALRGDGSVFPCEVSLTTLRRGQEALVHAIIRDISAQKEAQAERERLERQLWQAQKLESLGVLAGGIAHDFNNLLMGVLGYAGLGMEQLGPHHPVRRHLESIQSAAHRAANLTRQMLAYSGRGKFVVSEMDLSLQVEEMAHLLEVSIPKTVHLRRALERTLPLVLADAAQVQQVIMNLVINAAEAIGETQGTITVATGAQFLDRAYLDRVMTGQEMEAGPYVFLEVTDTGCGMDPDTQARIFEPFFTTKFTGRGLGLSAILGIVRGHKGGMQLYSEPGRGTTFKVFLPAAGPSEGAADEAALAEDRHGSGLILVVDDDASTRDVARQILERRGFQVLEARDGLEGLEVVRQCEGSLRLVILDLTMPRMGGEQAFREMRALEPELPVLLSSGYSEHEASTRFAGRPHLAFLQKPYGPQELMDRVAGLLG